MNKGTIDLKGQRFGRLLVLERCENNYYGRTCWLCKCDCDGKIVKITTKSLRNGDTQSCGCLNKERLFESIKKYNTYDLTGEFGVGYDHKGDSFLFDKEDYDKIKKYCWIVAEEYVKAYSMGDFSHKMIYLHRLIMGIDDKNIKIDHDNKTPSDNRKNNLRIATDTQNLQNCSLSIRNSSGVIGVDWMKSRCKYRARIQVNGEGIHLGVFNKIENAITARLKAEKEYFKEFAPQKHLFEEYGVI